ncbi:MAG: phytoene synthase [Flavobacteriales bacterium]|nr:phytoene synthase [Flavobacteriales bacterium]|tara:strand:+ start:54476 stop:55312 length:837 start_codon:yes stop_codon:yes gene_type:complete
MHKVYLSASLKSSKAITNTYSTSFSLGIRVLDSSLHDAIYAIYGFVRLADEIVDTFHEQDKEKLLKEFVEETENAIQRKISLNPVLNSFQWAVNKYKIDRDLIDAFIKSMAFDLSKKDYDRAAFDEYVYGSAEVVGLMCLAVFCGENKLLYRELLEPAKSLGAAFQKINFLRDLKADFKEKGRSYFPEIDLSNFTDQDKIEIESEIAADFEAGYKGIVNLPKNARFGVYTAYVYYYNLYLKIKKVPAKEVLQKRIRITNSKKYLLLIVCRIRYLLGFI